MRNNPSSSRSYTKLSNGIEIVTDPFPGAQTLSINVSMRAGSCDETGFPEGTAHFFEHMAFKGSVSRSAEEIRGQISANGGDLNASTDWDTTSFTCITLKEELAVSLDVMSDLVVNPALRNEDVELERNVILQELSDRKGTWATLDECFYASAYGEQDLARPIIGTEQGIRDITPDSLRSFMAKHYVTGNLVVAVSGDTDHALVTALVEEKFAKLPIGPRTPMPSFEYYGGEQGYACPCEQGIVKYGFEAPALSHRDSFALGLFHTITGGNPTARLFQELREKRGLVYNIDARPTHHCGNSLAVVSTTGPATKIRDILFAVHDTLHDASENITEEELVKAKRLKVAWQRMGRDSVESRTTTAIFELINEGKLADLAGELQSFEAVTLAELKRCARNLLAGPATLAVHGPARGMPKLQHLAARTNKVPAKIAA
jgi:predicted Zn-dependent peptidase